MVIRPAAVAFRSVAVTVRPPCGNARTEIRDQRTETRASDPGEQREHVIVISWLPWRFRGTWRGRWPAPVIRLRSTAVRLEVYAKTRPRIRFIRSRRWRVDDLHNIIIYERYRLPLLFLLDPLLARRIMWDDNNNNNNTSVIGCGGGGKKK